MGLEWVLLSLMAVVAVWLGMDACRESKKLQARLSRIEPTRLDGKRIDKPGDWAYWPLTTSTDDLTIGPRR